MTEAGADILVAHMGVTTGGSIGATSAKSLAELRHGDRRDRRGRAAPFAATSSSSATAARSRCRRTPSSSSSTAATATASTAPPAWSACRSRSALTEQTRKFKAIAMQLDAGEVGGEVGGTKMKGGKFVIAKETKLEVNDWGRLGWLSNPPNTGAKQLTVIDVNLDPGQGPRLPQAPRPGGGDPRRRRQGRAVGRPREAHPRAGRFRLHSGRRRPRFVQCRRQRRRRSSRSSGRASARSAMNSSTSPARRPGRRFDMSGRLLWAPTKIRSTSEHAARPGPGSARKNAANNNYPKLHNAMWPGVVGKGAPGAEPTIDLDTMLDLTAAAEVDGSQVRRRRPLPRSPRTSTSTSTTTSSSAMADKIAGNGLVIGSVVAPVWVDAAAARRWATDERAQALPDAGPQGLPDRQAAARAGRPARRRRPHRLLGRRRATGPRTRRATRRRSPRPSSRPRRSPRTTARGSPPRARSAGAACTPGGRWSTCSSGRRARTRRLPGRHGAHAALHPRRERPEGSASCRRTTTGRTRPRSTPPQEAHRRAAALDDRLPRRPERRHRLRLGHARPHRPPLPGDRPERQARHPPPRRLLAPRREAAS